MDRTRRSPSCFTRDLDPVCEGQEMRSVGLKELEDIESWLRYVMELHNDNRQGNFGFVYFLSTVGSRRAKLKKVHYQGQ